MKIVAMILIALCCTLTACRSTKTSCDAYSQVR
jgi:hypothetical protein